MEFADFMNLCDFCVYAPCVCGNDPENCASYVKKHGMGATPKKGERADG